jgi:hypothetical protein
LVTFRRRLDTAPPAAAVAGESEVLHNTDYATWDVPSIKNILMP